MEKITVYYDAACAGCRRDRRRYDFWAGKDRVHWFDINGQEEMLRAKGIDPQEARLKLHIEHPDGRIEKDIESYIVLLDQIPWLKPLAWMISLRWIREPLRRSYRQSVTRRLERDGYLVCDQCERPDPPPESR
ncbi:DCC1-like thiol-disulfide oxidoreductase family protein [Hahella ganghwensis]|uniref:DCC1-like thiol-disulfide oxidoreductase family protein n=1 Tax=Hahella ganghwensis TaxID=286420 RepID=UPI00037F9F92|nr:DCC1-like thiol-disulfide oxidoreductase family protein [Hahella ganghwensis]